MESSIGASMTHHPWAFKGLVGGVEKDRIGWDN